MTKILSNKTKSGDFTVPNTKDDMSEMEKWQHGQKLYGTFAKSLPAQKAYRNDIDKAWGKESKYKKNTIYINTMKPLGPQLKRYK